MLHLILEPADPKQQLQGILEASRIYSVILGRKRDGNYLLLEKSLQDLERIQGAPSYLLMLYLMLKQEELGLDEGHLESVSRSLVSFFVRRNLTDTPPTRDLTRLFISIVDDIKGLLGEDVLNITKERLRVVSAPDDVFINRLSGSIYDENSGVTRFILCSLAEQGMTRETKRDLWEYKGKNLLWTIEHIFPQGDNIPASWVDMIADGNYELAKKIQQSHAHKLGNLTMSGFNGELSNKGFIEKRDMTESGLYTGYRNGLPLNIELAEADAWTADSIDTRTANLVNEVMALFVI